MNQPFPQKGHPKGLYVLFATEMWERFNYYGMRAVLILFMTKALLFDKAFASNLYGSYTSLIYLTPLLGGYIADRYWGNGRSIIAGGIVMAIGEFILFFCSTFYLSSPQLSQILFFSGLGFMIAGNGFFKPNISSLVGQLYPKNDARKDPAYTIFYMGINTGGAIGPFICGMVGDTGNPADFRWAFLVGGIGMCISVIVQKLFQEKYVVDPEGKPLGTVPANTPKRWLNPGLTMIGLLILSFITIGLLYIDAKVVNYLFYLMLACVILIACLIFFDKSLSKDEKRKVAVIFTVSFFVVLFWGAFEQAGASLTFFADEQTDRHIGLSMPAWGIYLISALLLVYFVRLMIRSRKKLHTPYDERLRITVTGLITLLCLGIIAGNLYILSTGKTGFGLKELPASVFQSLNSTFVVTFAPLFAWLWLKLGKNQPGSPMKMAFGLFFLALGYLWIAFGVKDVGSGVKVSMIWLTGMYALHTCGELCLSPIGLALVNKLAPFKFASLLMAIWFTANAIGNKLAGVLSALYPQPGRPTSLLGIQIGNLNQFFMIFVFMAGAASIVLFFIARRLQRMMTAGD